MQGVDLQVTALDATAPPEPGSLALALALALTQALGGAGRWRWAVYWPGVLGGGSSRPQHRAEPAGAQRLYSASSRATALAGTA